MKILFFSPDFNRTGSEIVLHSLIQHADRTRLRMAVACGWKGALRQHLPPDVLTFDYSISQDQDAPEEGFRRLYRRALSSIVHRTHHLLYHRALPMHQPIIEDNIKQINEIFQPDVWYINTTVQPRVLRSARAMGIPCILHTHELEEVLARLGAEDVDIMINYPKLIIASSRSSENVLRVLGREQNIEVVYASLDIDGVRSTPDKARAIRKALKIADNIFVWVMVGTLDPNKNPVLFVKIADEMLRMHQPAHFLWLGGTENGYSVFARRLSERLNIAEKVSWITPHEGDYYDYLNAADGLVLTSRQESLSLASVEAAALGKPIVSFNSGGPREFLKDGMGSIIESWNVSDLVEAMLRVMRGDVYLNADISRARAREFDVSLQVRQWENLIQKCLA